MSDDGTGKTDSQTMTHVLCDVLPPLRGRLRRAIYPFAEHRLQGVTSHRGLTANLLYGARFDEMPDGLVLAAVLPRNTEQVYLLMRDGDRRFYWMDKVMSPWSSTAGAEARESLAAALADWDRGAKRVYVSDGMEREWPSRE